LPDELPLPDCDGLVVVSGVDVEDEEGCSVVVSALDSWPLPVPLDAFSGFVTADG
jgi:hypothetical protein